MRKTQSSMTAAGIAVARAVETEKRVDQRVYYDPYARQMVSGALFHLVWLFDRLGYTELRGPGIMGFLVARERHIDEILKSSMAGGIKQCVILGAGFDSRAYRFEEFKSRIKAFEVDHPATQEVKRQKLIKIFGRLPDYVAYVSVDFNKQSLYEQLIESGYNENMKTLFIWQGVTQYLAPQAVDDMLKFITDHSGPGSSVAFDYMFTSLLDGSVKHGEVSRMRQGRLITGESLVFGILEGSIETFLEQRGFCNIQNANHQTLHDAYFIGPNRKRTVADGYAIVHATVKTLDTTHSNTSKNQK